MKAVVEAAWIALGHTVRRRGRYVAPPCQLRMVATTKSSDAAPKMLSGDQALPTPLQGMSYAPCQQLQQPWRHADLLVTNLCKKTCSSIFCDDMPRSPVRNNLKKPALTKVQKPTPALFSVPRDLDLWPFDPKINVFPGLVVKHFCVKFGDRSCSVFLRYHANKKTDR